MKSTDIWDEEHILQTSWSSNNLTPVLPFHFKGLIEMKACKVRDDHYNLNTCK